MRVVRGEIEVQGRAVWGFGHFFGRRKEEISKQIFDILGYL